MRTDEFSLGVRGESTSNSEALPEKKDLGNRIDQLVLDSIAMASNRDNLGALNIAKKARKLTAKLQSFDRFEAENNAGYTFLALFNLAIQFENNQMYREALNCYEHIMKNKLGNYERIRINMGNVYLELRMYQKALKMYRIALDGTTQSNMLER